MCPDLDRLKQVLQRLRELELGAPARNDGDGPTAGDATLRDEVTHLARALHDNSYWRNAGARAAADARYAG